MPRLAAFPKAYMQALCKDGTMQLAEWIQLASKLDIDGLEWYAGFIEMQDEANWLPLRKKVEIFYMLIDKIHDPFFGVNYDPSNTYLAGEDPLELLKLVSNRVVTMHASDRYLTEGKIEDLRREEMDAAGYAKRLKHGEIGKGLNDYDAIFSELKSVGFNGWISIEDGVDGMEQLERSVAFLRRKMAEYW